MLSLLCAPPQVASASDRLLCLCAPPQVASASDRLLCLMETAGQKLLWSCREGQGHTNVINSVSMSTNDMYGQGGRRACT